MLDKNLWWKLNIEENAPTFLINFLCFTISYSMSRGDYFTKTKLNWNWGVDNQLPQFSVEYNNQTSS